MILKNKTILITGASDGIWVRGGSAFVLQVAMQKSGFEEIVQRLINNENFVYAGYSAGCCVLSPSLIGLEYVDDPKAVEDAYSNQEVIWEGLGVIDFTYVPHFKSDHPESIAIDEVVEYLNENNIYYKTFSDSQVFISEV